MCFSFNLRTSSVAGTGEKETTMEIIGLIMSQEMLRLRGVSKWLNTSTKHVTVRQRHCFERVRVISEL